MKIEQLEQLRTARLAEQVFNSIKQAEKDVWKRKCRSDRPIKLARIDRATAPRATMPQKLASVSKEPTNTNGRDLNAISKVGLKSGKKGYRYPKAGCRSMAQLIKRSALKDNGLPDELIDGIMKDQASRIRIPAKRYAKVSRIAEFLGISLREAMKPEYEGFELA